MIPLYLAPFVFLLALTFVCASYLHLYLKLYVCIFFWHFLVFSVITRVKRLGNQTDCESGSISGDSPTMTNSHTKRRIKNLKLFHLKKVKILKGDIEIKRKSPTQNYQLSHKEEDQESQTLVIFTIILDHGHYHQYISIGIYNRNHI